MAETMLPTFSSARARRMFGMWRRCPSVIAAVVAVAAAPALADPSALAERLMRGGGWQTVVATPSTEGGLPVASGFRDTIAAHRSGPRPRSLPGVPIADGLRLSAEHGPRVPSRGLQGMVRLYVRF